MYTDHTRERDPAAPGFADGLDPRVPHPARVYGYWLGGKDHYPADRQAAEEVILLRPQVVTSARANRQFLARVVRFLAGPCSVRQFLDIGTGLPAPDNTHEVAQQVVPDCRVVYCDNDPLVLAHARALLTSTPHGTCDYVGADLRDTATIVRRAAKTLDFSQPVAVLLLAILHFLTDADDPARVVAGLVEALTPGSYLAVSHLTADFAPGQVSAAATAYNTLAAVPVTARTHAQVTALLGGHPLVAPGLVPVSEWRPGTGSQARQPADLYAGVARVTRARRGTIHNQQAALEALAAALDPREFATTLVTGTARRPCLTVTSRHRSTESSIYAGQASYWWGSGEPVATISDPLTAAHKVATALRAAPQPAQDW